MSAEARNFFFGIGLSIFAFGVLCGSMTTSLVRDSQEASREEARGRRLHRGAMAAGSRTLQAWQHAQTMNSLRNINEMIDRLAAGSRLNEALIKAAYPRKDGKKWSDEP